MLLELSFMPSTIRDRIRPCDLPELETLWKEFSDEEDETRQSFLYWLALELASRRAIDFLRAQLRSDHLERRSYALIALSKVSPVDDLIEELVDAFSGDSGVLLRSAALYALAYANRFPLNRADVEPLLDDTDDELSTVAAIYLSRAFPEEAVSILRPLLSNSSVLRRKQACVEAGLSNRFELEADLRRLIEDPSEEVRKEAVDGLEALEIAAAVAVVERLGSTSESRCTADYWQAWLDLETKMGLLDYRYFPDRPLFHTWRLPETLRERNRRTILFAGNGVSQEPRAFAHAGFDVAAVDISPNATDEAMRSSLRDEHLSGTFCVVRNGEWEEATVSAEAVPGGSVRFVVGDLVDLAVEPGPFDCVISLSMLQYYEGEVLENLCRSLVDRLEPDGILIVGVHSSSSSWKEIRSVLEAIGLQIVDRPNDLTFTPARQAVVMLSSG